MYVSSVWDFLNLCNIRGLILSFHYVLKLGAISFSPQWMKKDVTSVLLSGFKSQYSVSSLHLGKKERSECLNLKKNLSSAKYDFFLVKVLVDLSLRSRGAARRGRPNGHMTSHHVTAPLPHRAATERTDRVKWYCFTQSVLSVWHTK